jgi:AbrB family looped-hinge helix DNA binding protein
MSMAKVTRNYQITIPKDIRDMTHIEEGSHLNFDVRNGEIVLTPQHLIDADQAWFWSDQWQADEKRVEAEKRDGDVVGPFKNISSMRKHFDDV